MKRHLFYTFLGIFLATSVVTLLGITGFVRIPDGYLTGLFTAFLAEVAAAVVAMFKRAEFFGEDAHHREIVAQMEHRHAAEIAQIRTTHSLAIAGVKAKHRQEIAKLTGKSRDSNCAHDSSASEMRVMLRILFSLYGITIFAYAVARSTTGGEQGLFVFLTGLFFFLSAGFSLLVFAAWVYDGSEKAREAAAKRTEHQGIEVPQVTSPA